jgi:hypothetical protein
MMLICSVAEEEEDSCVRTSFRSLSAVALAASVLPGAAGAAKKNSFHFTDTITGAQISATEAVFKTHDSRVGNGAGVQIVTLNGLSGTDAEISYYGNASAKSHGSFKLGVPDANGISKLTGQGRDTSGTGKLRGFTSTYTYTGTFNTKTLVFNVVLKGTGSTR